MVEKSVSCETKYTGTTILNQFCKDTFSCSLVPYPYSPWSLCWHWTLCTQFFRVILPGIFINTVDVHSLSFNSRLSGWTAVPPLWQEVVPLSICNPSIIHLQWTLLFRLCSQHFQDLDSWFAQPLPLSQMQALPTHLDAIHSTKTRCLTNSCCHRFTRALQCYGINGISDKSPQKQFDGDTTMTAVITLWESVTKCQTIINSSAKLTMTTHWVHQLLIMGINLKYITWQKVSSVYIHAQHDTWQLENYLLPFMSALQEIWQVNLS